MWTQLVESLIDQAHVRLRRHGRQGGVIFFLIIWLNLILFLILILILLLVLFVVGIKIFAPVESLAPSPLRAGPEPSALVII